MSGLNNDFCVFDDGFDEEKQARKSSEDAQAARYAQCQKVWAK